MNQITNKQDVDDLALISLENVEYVLSHYMKCPDKNILDFVDITPEEREDMLVFLEDYGDFYHQLLHREKVYWIKEEDIPTCFSYVFNKGNFYSNEIRFYFNQEDVKESNFSNPLKILFTYSSWKHRFSFDITCKEWAQWFLGELVQTDAFHLVPIHGS